MLPRKSLVNLKKEFPRIRKEGKLYDSPSFGLVISYHSTLNPQCAFVVSKKIDRRSVVRHNVKRKLSDAVAPYLSRLPQKTQLVFLAKQKAVTTDKGNLSRELEELLRRIKLIS